MTPRHGTSSSPIGLALLALLVVCGWTAMPVRAQEEAARAEEATQSNPPQEIIAQPQSGSRLKVGLVLGGGGARGGAHLGVLETLEELRIPVDAVAGTSMGAFIGGLYASGMTVAEIRSVLEDTDWDLIFSPAKERTEEPFREKQFDRDFLVRYGIGLGKGGRLTLPESLVPAQRLLQLIERLTGGSSGVLDFDKLPVPFASVTTDFETGDEVVLQRGALARAIYASMAVPGLLPPTETQGRLLVDGGMANNVPVSVMRTMGVDVLIVVDVGSPFHKRGEIDSFLKAMDQVIKMTTRRNVEATLDDIRENEILLQPELEGVATGGFEKVGIAIDAGLAVAETVRDRLEPLGIPAEDYLAWESARTADPVQPERIISRIEIENGSWLGDESIRRRLGQKPGDVLDEEKLRRAMTDLYSMSAFNAVTYEVIEERGETIVVIRAKGDRATLGRIRLGIRLEDDFDGQNSYTFGVEYRRPGINPLGGELRLRASFGETLQALAEIYQPLDPLQRWFVDGQIDYTEQNLNLFSDGDIVTELQIEEARAIVSGGRVFGNWGELRAGYVRGLGDVDTQVGLENISGDFDSGALFARFTLDTLDRAFFPRSGQGAIFEWEMEDSSFGSDADFQVASAEAITSHSYGRMTGIFGLSGASNIDGDSVPQGLLPLGGFLNLSGYQFRELSGDDIALARSIFYYRMFGRDVASPVSMPVYLGGSIELGNAWPDGESRTFDSLQAAGSLWVGADTLLGPIYIGGGIAEGGNRTLYLFLGDPF